MIHSLPITLFKNTENEKRTIEGFYQTKCYLFAFDGKNGRTKSIGADYCSISGYNYNGRLKSAELLLKENGEVELIRRAETPKDYFATFDFSDILK